MESPQLPNLEIRYFCYTCHDTFLAMRNMQTCPQCQNGFVEETESTAEEIALANLRHQIFQRLRYHWLFMVSRKPLTPNKIKELSKIPISAEQCIEKLNCIICITDFNLSELATNLPCNHVFHPTCINKWLKQNGTCPTCRTSVDSEETEGHDIENIFNYENLDFGDVIDHVTQRRPSRQSARLTNAPYTRRSNGNDSGPSTSSARLSSISSTRSTFRFPIRVGFTPIVSVQTHRNSRVPSASSSTRNVNQTQPVRTITTRSMARLQLQQPEIERD